MLYIYLFSNYLNHIMVIILYYYLFLFTDYFSLGFDNLNEIIKLLEKICSSEVNKLRTYGLCIDVEPYRYLSIYLSIYLILYLIIYTLSYTLSYSYHVPGIKIVIT
jgi:hypothetical protein